MKKSLLLLFVCLFGALSGVKAYTTENLESAGWELVKNLDDIASNVYVFVDAGAQKTAVVRGAAQANRPRYNTLDNPILNKQEVWAIEKYGDNYAILGIEDNYYFSSGDAGWNDGMTNGVDGNKGLFTFNPSGEKYNICAAAFSGDNYMGPWNNEGSVDLTGSRSSHDWTEGDGMEDIAVNKSSAQAPGYFLYKMSKRDYLEKYLQQVPNLAAPVDVSYLIFNSKIYQGGETTSRPDSWRERAHTTDDGKYTEGTANTHLYAKRSAWGSQEHTLNFDYYQTISNLPRGDYRAKADVFGPNSSHGGQFKAYLYVTTTSEKQVEMDSQNWTSKTTDYGNVSEGGGMDIGIKANFKFSGGTASTHTADAKGDNFSLETDPYLSTMATEFTNGVEMTAGLWYHFTVAKTGNHILTATALGDIIYATGETTALSAAGSTTFSGLQTLDANTVYYIRSSSNNTLTITPCISTVAEDLPDNGAMTAGKWYYFDAPIDGNFYNFTATTLSDIVYTTNGNLASNTTSVTDHFKATDNSLTATRYYVKSATAQSLVMSMADGTDLTDLIKNPTCVGGVEGWEGGGTYAEGGVEFFNTTEYDFHQTLNNLPNGYYKLGAQAFYRAGDKNTTASACNAKLYAGSYEVDVMNINQYQVKTENPGVGTWIQPTGQPFYVPDNTQAADAALIVYEAYHNYVIAYVSNGSMTIGIKKNAEVGNDWTFMDNFTLTYLGTEIANEDFTYLIKEADCSTITQDYWLGEGRTTKVMDAYDGKSRSVFNANNDYSTDSKGGQRHQAITLPFAGAYKLTVFCKVPSTGVGVGYAQIWVDDLGNYINNTSARHLYTVNTSGSKTSDINYNGEGWYANEIYFTANANESKTIYINLSAGDGTDERLKFAYVSGTKLTYLGGAPEVSFDEAVENPVVEANLANANVTIKRNMKSDRWNTFTVPFNMAIPGEWTVKELTGVDYNESTSNYSLTFSDASSIVAGKAYMVKPVSDVDVVNANDVTVNTSTVTPSQVADDNHTANFVGNNSYMASAPAGSYIISNNVFYCVNSNVTQKGFRGYITVSDNNNARATVSFGTDEDVTGIQNVVVEGLEESDALKDGKYLIDNKIVIVKNGVKYGANGQKLN